MNNIVVISGPSGSGKTTLIKKLKKEFPDINFSVSFTTRKKRTGETEGKDYYFIESDDFKRMIKNSDFIEWVKVFDNYYGTSIKELKKKSSGGNVLILDIDVRGAKEIKKKFPGSLLIFIEPPNEDLLRKRLIKREKREDNDVRKRLDHSKKEMENSDFYDFHVVNDKLDIAYRELRNIFINYLKERDIEYGRS